MATEIIKKWEARKRQVLEQFGACLGYDPPPCDLQPESLGTCAVGPWQTERSRFCCEAGDLVSALLLHPQTPAKPPVVIALHGYSGTKEAAILETGELSDSGIAVLAIDARCHGERLKADAPDPAKDYQKWHDVFEAEWQWLARRALVNGASLQGMLVHDVQRAIDYLQTRQDLDADRLGIYGYSMGGTTAWAAAAVESRIKTVALGGCLIEYQTALRVRRDASWHAWVPGVAKFTSRAELVSTIAPRPLLAIHGEDDFPIEGVQPVVDAAAEKYSQYGCPERFRSVMLAGDHAQAAADKRLRLELKDWFTKWL